MSPSKTTKPSVVPVKVAKLEELILFNSKLRFCPEQLQNLNYLFHRKLEKKSEPLPAEKSTILAKSVAERLVQRLVCSAGIQDARFASKFLISCNNTHHQNSEKLEYIVRLDSLSTPCLYKTDQMPKYTVIERESDYPAGYARIRLNNPTMKVWSDFVNSAGYLRRDRIQAKMVELLSQAASATKTPDSPLQIDDSILCASPGKIVNAATLYHILQIPPEHQIFYGPSGYVPRFPDPRDFRLAIVDEPQGILIKIEFLSPALNSVTVRVRLLLGIGLDFWPSTTDFPTRIPLGHSDCLLYYKAAQTGCFLVGFGVQSSAWQLRVPAAEYMILNDFSPNSTVHSVLDLLLDAMEEIHSFNSTRKLQLSYKILNHYNMQTALFKELEKDQEAPSSVLINWSPLYLSTIVLKILDKLILCLKDQKQPNYFFANANLLVNPGHLCEDDFMLEAEKIQMHLLRLFDESLMSTKGNKGFNEIMIAQNTEMLLLNKWKEIVKGLLPPSTTRQRKLCFRRTKKLEAACGKYSKRQHEYISLILKQMLNVKEKTQQQPSDDQPLNFFDEAQSVDDPLEDFVYLLVAIVQQARDQYFNNQSQQHERNKLKMKYDTATTKLVDSIRRDKNSVSLELHDDHVFVKTILKYLYKGLEQNKKVYGPVLNPYLTALFQASHAISWHLEFFKKLTQNDELEALGSFAGLVNEGKITPAQGLLDAVAKNWIWAKNLLQQVEEGNLRLIFVPERGKVYRHILALANKKREHVDGSKTLQRPKIKDGDSRSSTLPRRNYFNTILKQHSKASDEQKPPQHDLLKKSSPLTSLLQQTHRRGDHRCRGDILQALLSIQKLSVLQDVSSHLPEDERTQLLETIHKLTNTTRHRRLLTKKWSTSLPQFTKARLALNENDLVIQKYTPKEESAGIPLQEDAVVGRRAVLKRLERGKGEGTLIGSCRAVRIREDSGIFCLQEGFKGRSLMKNSKE